jgi:hypothetical protein
MIERARIRATEHAREAIDELWETLIREDLLPRGHSKAQPARVHTSVGPLARLGFSYRNGWACIYPGEEIRDLALSQVITDRISIAFPTTAI